MCKNPHMFSMLSISKLTHYFAKIIRKNFFMLLSFVLHNDLNLKSCLYFQKSVQAFIFKFNTWRTTAEYKSVKNSLKILFRGSIHFSSFWKKKTKSHIPKVVHHVCRYEGYYIERLLVSSERHDNWMCFWWTDWWRSVNQNVSSEKDSFAINQITSKGNVWKDSERKEAETDITLKKLQLLIVLLEKSFFCLWTFSRCSNLSIFSVDTTTG